MKAFLVLISVCLMPLSANAGVYKWVDANGQTHFGDRPPAQAASSEVTVKAAPASVDAGARERHQRMTEFLEQQQEERETRQAANDKAEEKAEVTAEAKAAAVREAVMQDLAEKERENAEEAELKKETAEREKLTEECDAAKTQEQCEQNETNCIWDEDDGCEYFAS